jgi:uncharacterized repeat protein (TIGR03803 family)
VKQSRFNLTIVLLGSLMILGSTVTASAHAQTFVVLHTFTGGGDGGKSNAGLTLDSAGNLYGTTAYGTVFRMKRIHGSWVLNTLFTFDGRDGGSPLGRVVFGPRGALFGTTHVGGTDNNGVVYKVTAPMSVCGSFGCPWSQTVLYNFAGSPDGSAPGYVDPVFDQAGNLYGTSGGGANGDGTVFELTFSDGQWSETILHNFNGADGSGPASGVILDSAGNVYGTTDSGGPFNNGTVYELSPSGSGWQLTTLYAFPDRANGAGPVGPLILDHAGNLYGTTTAGGPNEGGTVFELSPSGNGWSFSLLHAFTCSRECGFGGPEGNLAMDAAGNLYGVTHNDGGSDPGAIPDLGSVWKLTRSGDGWTYTDLYDFTGGSDGYFPIGGPSLDSSGNIYGTTVFGGAQSPNCDIGCGVVWEITP